MPLKNTLRSRTKRFGENFVDDIILPELEFRLGHVERVFTNRQDLNSYKGKLRFKIPSNPSGCILIKAVKGVLPIFGNESIAKPLLRGISDSIARGDLVLFTDIGNQTYYLGPINTTNEVTVTPDSLSTLKKNPIVDSRKDHQNGYSQNFPPPKTPVTKLIKTYMPQTDFPNGINKGNFGTDAYHEGSFSDVTLDGRHGNSIRIGSRSSNPILNIHNGRYKNAETLNDGSLISMTSLGSLNDNWVMNQDYLLSSDRKIGSEYQDIQEGQYSGYLLNFGNDGEPGDEKREDTFDYDYGSISSILENGSQDKDQMIIFSDRITFDARKNDFTVSAFRNINFGAGKNFTLTNKGYSVFESKNIYIGKGAKQRSQPMVLGEELRRLLVSILRLINDSRALVQGVPIPLVKQDTSPLLADITKIMQEFNLGTMPAPGGSPESPVTGYDTQMTGSNMDIPLGDRTIGGATFFSNHHFIETNRS